MKRSGLLNTLLDDYYSQHEQPSMLCILGVRRIKVKSAIKVLFGG